MNILFQINLLAKKLTHIICSLAFFGLFNSLYAQAQDFCSTPETSDNFIYESVLQSANNNGPFYLKIYVHVIRDDDGNGGQNVQNVEDALVYLDEDFNPHNIFFVWDCQIDYIDDNYWYAGPANNSRGIFSVNNHNDGIDIYLFPDNANKTGGRANGVGESSEFWVSGIWDGIPVSRSHIISHEMGHVLNLWHTHHSCESGGVWEKTDGSNCEVSGDFVCDTPADPYMRFDVDSNTCEWSGIPYCSAPEPASNYNPDTKVIMAYSYPGCMEYFTGGQGERARNSIATLPYLQNTIISNIACGEEDLCEENNYDPQVFIEYPWLLDVIAGRSCQSVTIEVYDFSYYTFIHVSLPSTPNLPAENSIYYMTGEFWCKSRPSLNCKAYYGLTNPDAVTCGCTQTCTDESCPSPCEQKDRNALLALYNSTNGENWNITWDIDQPISNWNGVTLDENGCVKVLNLPNNGLTGTLAAEVSTLTELTYLNLADNAIGGNLPSSIGNLQNVGFIDFRNNQLTGAIPENISTLPILNFLHLEYNNLTGGIPPSFADMENLSFLYLNHNQLSNSYAPQLKTLCEQLNNSNNANISDGNNFEQTWSSFCFDGGEVWPGDANIDGIVDENDVAFWGIAVGNQGPARASEHQNTDWYPHPAQDWGNETNGINGKHQDADGNGIVDGDDLNTISNNQGNENNNGSITLSIAQSELNFRLETLSSQNDVIPVKLFIEDLQGADILAHGISGVFYFDNPAITNVNIDITGSALNPNPQYVYQQYNANANSLAFAITRTDGNNELCDDYVLTLEITIGPNLSNDDNEINIQLTKGKVILSDGIIKNIANSSINLMISDIQNLDIFATAQVIQQECNSLGKAIINAYGGVPPYYFQWNTGVTTNIYENLLAGTYEVTITDSNNDSETLIVVIDEFEPVYDSNGELICGNACKTYTYPTGNISNGTTRAKLLLESDATIQQNAAVEFTAGERIRLNTGFSTKQNSTFRGAIEDCE